MRQQQASSVLRQLSDCVRAPKGAGGSAGKGLLALLGNVVKSRGVEEGKLLKLNNGHSWIWTLELKVFPSCQMLSHENPG